MDDPDEDYHLPLLDQRIFGAGVRRKRIHFVRPSDPQPSQQLISSGPSVSERYLSIVLPSPNPSDSSSPSSATPQPDAPPPLCTVCSLPILASSSTSGPHEASLAHQSCLPHSHPPSHLPRAHIGLRYLQSHGWDPDSRTGLGAEGKGIRTPIKGVAKNNTVGLGVQLKTATPPEKGAVQRLNAKEARRMEMDLKKKEQRLRDSFYHNEDLERYLGSLA